MLHSTVINAYAGRGNARRLFLPPIANLIGRYSCKNSATLFTAMAGSGPSPPAVTLSGTRTDLYSYPLDIQIDSTDAGITLGTATFRWSADGGKTWTGGIPTTAGPLLLGSTGKSVSFSASGNFNVEQRWTSTISTIATTIPSPSTTITQPTAAAQPVLTFYGCNGYPRLSFDGFNDALEGTSGVVSTLLNGTDKPFTLVIVGYVQAISSSATGAQPIAGWARVSVSSNPFWHWGVRGPAGTPANVWESIREDNVGTNVPVNDGSSPVDFDVHVWVIRSDGQNVTITEDGAQILSGAQDVGAMTIDRFQLGGIRRAGGAFAGLNIGVIETDVYNTDVGATSAQRLASAYMMAYAIGNDAQVKEVHCIICWGASNSNGVTVGGAGTPGTSMAPPPGNFWTSIPYLRRILAPNGDAISDVDLTRLKFNTAGGGNYHGVSLQCTIDFMFSGRRAACLQVSADGSFLQDWIGAGTYAARLATALGDMDAMLASKYVNATRKYYLYAEEYTEVRDATPVRANVWAANFATLRANIEATLGTTLSGVSISLCPTILTVAPSSAPQFAVVRAQQAIAAAAVPGGKGLTFDPDPYSNKNGYVMSDNTHYFGRCANFVGGGNAANLLSVA
jgi:hypothetical protein